MMTSTNSQWFYWCVGEATGGITAANEDKCPWSDLLSSSIGFLRITQVQARSNANVSSFQLSTRNFASLMMRKSFDNLYLIPASCYDFCQILCTPAFSFLSFTHLDDNNHVITEKNTHRCSRPRARRACTAASNRQGLNITSNSSLSRDAYNENTKREGVLWRQVPCRSCDSALSSSPCTVNFLHAVAVRYMVFGGRCQTTFIFVSQKICFFFMDLSQSATK